MRRSIRIFRDQNRNFGKSDTSPYLGMLVNVYLIQLAHI